jgi:hypothetical protein
VEVGLCNARALRRCLPGPDWLTVFRANASHWRWAGADDDGALGHRFPSWRHRRGTPSLAAVVMASPGENPNSFGVGGGGVYVAIFLKTLPWSR